MEAELGIPPSPQLVSGNVSPLRVFVSSHARGDGRAVLLRARRFFPAAKFLADLVAGCRFHSHAENYKSVFWDSPVSRVSTDYKQSEFTLFFDNSSAA